MPPSPRTCSSRRSSRRWPASGLSEAFVGLVIVAIAGNAVENVVGVQAAAADKTDLATSLILNSSLQVAIALTPALVLISLVLGTGALTLVLTPLLVGAVVLAALLAAVIVFDGESTWLEGAGAARPLRDHRRERLVRTADPALTDGVHAESGGGDGAEGARRRRGQMRSGQAAASAPVSDPPASRSSSSSSSSAEPGSKDGFGDRLGRRASPRAAAWAASESAACCAS